MRQPFGNHRGICSGSEGREQQKQKFTLTTFHLNAISVEAVRAYPQDIDATALRKSQKNLRKCPGTFGNFLTTNTSARQCLKVPGHFRALSGTLEQRKKVPESARALSGTFGQNKRSARQVRRAVTTKRKAHANHFHSNAISMEATRAYPQDIDATARRKPEKHMSGGREQQNKSSR